MEGGEGVCVCYFFSQLQHLSSKGFVVLGLGGVLVFVDPRCPDPSGRGEGSRQEAKSCLSPADTSGGGTAPHQKEEHRVPQESFPSPRTKALREGEPKHRFHKTI